jgi:hypothetical protein
MLNILAPLLAIVLIAGFFLLAFWPRRAVADLALVQYAPLPAPAAGTKSWAAVVNFNNAGAGWVAEKPDCLVCVWIGSDYLPATNIDVIALSSSTDVHSSAQWDCICRKLTLKPGRRYFSMVRFNRPLPKGAVPHLGVNFTSAQ